MARMRIYTVHVNPAKAQAYEAAEFVREGFNWAAFIFTGIWALYHRLWWWALAIIGGNIALLGLVHVRLLSHPGFLVVHSAIHLLVGFYGNDWRQAKLRRKGYIVADIVAGDSLLGAELRFFDRYFGLYAPAKVS